MKPLPKGKKATGRNHSKRIVSKSIDPVTLRDKNSGNLKPGLDGVINQNSLLIKHEFDGGKSKLLRRHDLTNKAHLRMQQLIAILKHKTGNKSLVLTEAMLSEPTSQTGSQPSIQEVDPILNNEESVKRIITIETGDDSFPQIAGGGGDNTAKNRDRNSNIIHEFM